MLPFFSQLMMFLAYTSNGEACHFDFQLGICIEKKRQQDQENQDGVGNKEHDSARVEVI